MRLAFWILSALFATFAIVQLNDVDPWLWVSYYTLLAFLFAGAALKRFNIYVTGVALLITAIGLIRLLPEFRQWISDDTPSIVGSMKAETPYVEFVREFLGLLLSLLSILFLLSQRKRLSLLKK